MSNTRSMTVEEQDVPPPSAKTTPKPVVGTTAKPVISRTSRKSMPPARKVELSESEDEQRDESVVAVVPKKKSEDIAKILALLVQIVTVDQDEIKKHLDHSRRVQLQLLKYLEDM